jgi:hypothetical protein
MGQATVRVTLSNACELVMARLGHLAPEAVHTCEVEALARRWERQGEINDEQQVTNQRLSLAIERLEGSVERHDVILDRVTRPLDRVETLLLRLPRGRENGRQGV